MAEQDKPDNAEAHAKADADGSTMDRIKTGAFERNVALTRMGVGAGAKIAGHTVRNFFRRGESKDEANRNFYRAQAKELADELGRLKGSVMKAGQMLSLYGQYFCLKRLWRSWPHFKTTLPQLVGRLLNRN